MSMSKYNKQTVERICELIKTDTYTVVEICRVIGISEALYYKWKGEKVEFLEAIKKAEDARMQFFVAEAKKSLLKKIQGYTVQEKKIVTVHSGKIDKNGNPIPKIKEQSIIDKHFQPDTAAIIFTLTNGEPESWKNRQLAEVTGKDGKDLFASLTDDELDARIAELERKLGKYS